MILARLKLYAAAAAMTVTALLASYFYGRGAGNSAARAERDRQRIDGLRTAIRVTDDVDALDTDALVGRASKWVRDPKR